MGEDSVLLTMRKILDNPSVLCGAVVLIMFVLAAPVSATFQIQQSELNPAKTPLEPKSQQSVTAIITIIPQGATTFIVGNQLQLSTELNTPQWDVQVMVNGIPAAVIPAKGNTAFINGFLLSYPNSNDVSVSASVTGYVPEGVASVTLLQVNQQNNAGQTIPGAVQTISAPVAVPATVMTTDLPSPTSPVPTMVPPAPTTAPGMGPAVLAGGLLVGGLVAWLQKKG